MYETKSCTGATKIKDGRKVSYVMCYYVSSKYCIEAKHLPIGRCFCYAEDMNKNRTKRNRPDFDGNERGIYAHNKAILRKTATVCALCGLPLDKSLKYPDPMSISIDHIIPVALGGKSTIDNLQAAHLICNKEKGKKLLNLDKKEQKNSNFETKNAKNGTLLPQYIDWANY